MVNKYKAGWKAYEKGGEAFHKGIGYSRNPYKMPKLAFNWSVGWLDARKANKKQKSK